MPVSDGVDGGRDRDDRGRFLRGNKSGRGNDLHRRVARHRELVDKAVSDADTLRVLGALAKAARGGDVAAGRLVLAYKLGRARLAPAAEHVDVEIPAIASAADCVAASSAILGALGRRDGPQSGREPRVRDAAQGARGGNTLGGRQPMRKRDLQKRLEALERRPASAAQLCAAVVRFQETGQLPAQPRIAQLVFDYCRFL
ncbi:MAG: hypothetical protein ACYTDU_21075, partial [Planctomycetota bacterium]